MNYTKIKTKKQYKDYMSRFSKVFHAKSGTKEGDEAELLALIIKDYEDKEFPIEASISHVLAPASAATPAVSTIRRRLAPTNKSCFQ